VYGLDDCVFLQLAALFVMPMVFLRSFLLCMCLLERVLHQHALLCRHASWQQKLYLLLRSCSVYAFGSLAALLL
jgi:hypothetical protein